MKTIKKTVKHTAPFLLVACIILLDLSFNIYCCEPESTYNNSLNRTGSINNEYLEKNECGLEKPSCCSPKVTKEFSHHTSIDGTNLSTKKNISPQPSHRQCCSDQNNSLCWCGPIRSDNSDQDEIKNTAAVFVRLNLIYSVIVTPVTNPDTHNKLLIANSHSIKPFTIIPIYLQNLSLLI